MQRLNVELFLTQVSLLLVLSQTNKENVVRHPNSLHTIREIVMS